MAQQPELSISFKEPVPAEAPQSPPARSKRPMFAFGSGKSAATDSGKSARSDSKGPSFMSRMFGPSSKRSESVGTPDLAVESVNKQGDAYAADQEGIPEEANEGPSSAQPKKAPRGILKKAKEKTPNEDGTPSASDSRKALFGGVFSKKQLLGGSSKKNLEEGETDPVAAAEGGDKPVGFLRKATFQRFGRKLGYAESKKQLDLANAEPELPPDPAIPFNDEPDVTFLAGIVAQFKERVAVLQFNRENVDALIAAGDEIIKQLEERNQATAPFDLEELLAVQKEILRVDGYIRRTKEYARRASLASIGALALDRKRIEADMAQVKQLVAGVVDRGQIIKRSELMDMIAELREKTFLVRFNTQNCALLIDPAIQICSKLALGIRVGLTEQDAAESGDLPRLYRVLARVKKYIEHSYNYNKPPNKVVQASLRVEREKIQTDLRIVMAVDLIFGVREWTTKEGGEALLSTVQSASLQSIEAQGEARRPDYSLIKDAVDELCDQSKVFVNKINCRILDEKCSQIKYFLYEMERAGILMPPEEEASVAAAIGQARMYVENSRSLGGMPTRIQAKLYENERRRIEEVLDRVLTEGEMLKMVVKSDNEDLGTVETANREHFLAVCQRINKKETKVRFNVRQMKELTDFVEQYQKAVEKGAKLGILKDEGPEHDQELIDIRQAYAAARDALDFVETCYNLKGPPGGTRVKSLTATFKKLEADLVTLRKLPTFNLLFAASQAPTKKGLSLHRSADAKSRGGSRANSLGVTSRKGSASTGIASRVASRLPSAMHMDHEGLVVDEDAHTALFGPGSLLANQAMSDNTQRILEEVYAALKRGRVLEALEAMDDDHMSSEVIRLALFNASMKYQLPLCFLKASELGKLDLLKCMEKGGLRTNHKDVKGRNALHIACMEGHYDIAKWLVEEIWAEKIQKYLDIVSKDPAMIAKIAKEPRLREIYWNALEEPSILGKPALLCAIGEGHHDIAKMLVANGADVENADSLQRRPLHYACGQGDFEMVKFLVKEAGADPESEAAAYYHMRPLFFAVQSGHLEIVRWLVQEAHVDHQATMSLQEMPIHQACEYGHLEIVRYLVKELKQSVEATSGFDNKRPIHYASQNNRVEVVRFLVEECHAAKNAKAKFDRTALHYAAERGRLATVRYLADEAKVNLRVPNYEGVTALAIAKKLAADLTEAKEKSDAQKARSKKKRVKQLKHLVTSMRRRGDNAEAEAKVDAYNAIVEFLEPRVLAAQIATEGALPPQPKGFKRITAATRGFFMGIDDRTMEFLESDRMQNFIHAINRFADGFDERVHEQRLRARAASVAASKAAARVRKAGRVAFSNLKAASTKTGGGSKAASANRDRGYATEGAAGATSGAETDGSQGRAEGGQPLSSEEFYDVADGAGDRTSNPNAAPVYGTFVAPAGSSGVRRPAEVLI